MVTGNTAINIDTSGKLERCTADVPRGRRRPGHAPAPARIPLDPRADKAVLGFLLTIAASLGAVVWIFQQGHLGGVRGRLTGPIISFLPILMIAILFGLAMDYEVFLVSRMREDFVRTGQAQGSTVSGFQAERPRRQRRRADHDRRLRRLHLRR